MKSLRRTGMSTLRAPRQVLQTAPEATVLGQDADAPRTTGFVGLREMRGSSMVARTPCSVRNV